MFENNFVINYITELKYNPIGNFILKEFSKKFFILINYYY